VDLGAYEFQTGSAGEFIEWLGQYGLPTDGSADYLDLDGDSLNNWQEWVTGTNPTNAASTFRLQSLDIGPAGLLLTWSSETNCLYTIERATSLNGPPAFSVIQSNIPGLLHNSSYTDTAALALGTAFYRVAISPPNGPSALSLDNPTFVAGSATLTWLSVTNRSYFVERATNLSPPAAFSLLATNIAGLFDTTSFIDKDPPTSSSVFYRVGVQP
jgi:hypothetical protein